MSKNKPKNVPAPIDVSMPSMGPDLEKVMVSRVEIYPLKRVTATHPPIYSKDCKGKSQGVKISPQIYPLEEIFYGTQDPRNLEP